MKKTKEPTPESTPNPFLRFWRMIRSGEIVSGEWFARNWMKVFAVLFTIFCYITCRFGYSSTMESIIAERERLNTIQAEETRQRTLYNSRICETSMQELVDSLHLNLTVQTQPPFIIE